MKYIKVILANIILFTTIVVAQKLDEDLVLLTNIENSYPHWSPDGSKIVFQSDRLNNNNEIYVMDDDGSNIVRLTNNSTDDLTPVWSPDGEKIAFQSVRDGNSEIYVMNTDGSNQKNITHYLGEDMHPKWSADSKKLIFSSIRGYWNFVDIYEINIDGSGLNRITTDVSIDTYAEWSHDGSKIITRRIISGYPNSEIFLLDADGSNSKNITMDSAFDGWPSWHPSGKKIVYASEGDNGIANIYEINIDGENRKSFFTKPGSWTKPIWSHAGNKLVFTRSIDGYVDIYTMNANNGSDYDEPVKITNMQDKYPNVSADGSQVIFQSNRSGNWQIYLLNIETRKITRITNNDANDEHPRFSTDGKRITFTSDRDGNSEIYVMNIDGSNQINLSQHIATDIHPSWSPDGEKLIFNSNRDTLREYGIYTMNHKGTNVVHLSDPSIANTETYASYSPDGSKIVFVRWFEKNNGEVFIMNSDGSNPRNISNHSSFDGYPCWSPNNKTVLFSSNRSGKFTLYTKSIDSDSLNILLAEPFDEHQIRASWSKKRNLVVFNTQSEGDIKIFYFELSKNNDIH